MSTFCIYLGLIIRAYLGQDTIGKVSVDCRLWKVIVSVLYIIIIISKK